MGGQASTHQDYDRSLQLPRQQIVSAVGAQARTGLMEGGGGPGVVPPQQQITNTDRVKLQYVWNKSSFKLVRKADANHKWQLSAELTTEVPCTVTVHFGCQEKVTGQHMTFEPVGDAPPVHTQDVAAGKCCLMLDGGSIDLQTWPLEVHWKYRGKSRPSDRETYPIAMSVQGASMQLVTYLTLATSDRSLTCTVLKQKVFIGGRDYTIEEVFGGLSGLMDSTHDESAMGEPCVICLTNPRTTAVLPCRHLCVCEDCGTSLRMGAGGNRCPICRGDIQSLRVFDVKR